MKLTARKFRVTAISASLIVSIFIADQALAATNPPVCNPTESDTYACVSFTGYFGRDPFNYWQFGRKSSDGTWHNCTSYVAYRLYYSNYPSNFSGLHDASTWAAEAPSLFPGTKVGKVAHIGDVAQWVQANHVAYVDDVVLHTDGTLWYVVISEDNISFGTTSHPLYGSRVRQLFASQPATLPDNFITFPGYVSSGLGGSGGGKGPYPTIVTTSGGN